MIVYSLNRISLAALLFVLLGSFLPLTAQEAGPRLFFTDLESGPNTGGEQNLGAFITIYGEGFSSSRGNSMVTIGGREIARYVLWGQDNAPRSLDMIVVQPGPNAVSGNIIVTINGNASNPLPFTIRSGSIYFVATSGNDSYPGSFTQPWRTIVKAKNTIAGGDIAYIHDGVIQSAEENYSAALSIETGGTQGYPKALVAYPGATATIGSTNIEFGIRVPNNPGTIANDWVFAKLVMRGQIEAVEIGGDGSSRWRVVGNNISCPVGDGQIGCFTASLASNISFLGNEVHGVSKQGPQPSKQYHAVYFTTDTNHVEVGWNEIHDNSTCRAIQFHSSPLMQGTGYNQYDLNVHDNLIHGDVCDGIVFATVDPSKGPVRAFNNVIFDVGLGPDPPDGSANYSGIYVAGSTNTGTDGKGEVEIFNNTLYNCGARKFLPNAIGDEGAFGRGPDSPALFMTLKNNVVYAVSGEDYISPSSSTTLVRGNNNLWFGSGAPPAFLTANVSGDPQFVNLGARNFRLQAQSPAIDAGTNTGILCDYDGIPRPQGSAYDLGAHEYVQQQQLLPHIYVNPTSLNFGEVNVGNTSDQQVAVRNDGSANLIIGTITLPSLPFSKIADNCSGQTLSPGASCTVTYQFSTTLSGTFSSYSNIPSNDPYENPVTLSLNGVGVIETVSIPNILTGPVSGFTGTSYPYTTGGSTSSAGHTVEYQFDWKGDGTDLSSWGSATQSKTWTTNGTYNVRARARCTQDTSIVSVWSNSLSININVFSDVPSGYWAYNYILAIYNAHITTGCSQNPLKYCPEDFVTREQMAAFIVRAKEGEPAANYCDSGVPFTDVTSTMWSCKYIKRLKELGITTGYGDGSYGPLDTVTREQMAAFIVRAKEGEPAANYCSTGSSFPDVDVNNWSCKYIKRLKELGITTGYGDGRYGPLDLVTRAQMAAFLARAFLGLQ